MWGLKRTHAGKTEQVYADFWLKYSSAFLKIKVSSITDIKAFTFTIDRYVSFLLKQLFLLHLGNEASNFASPIIELDKKVK